MTPPPADPTTREALSEEEVESLRDVLWPGDPDAADSWFAQEVIRDLTARVGAILARRVASAVEKAERRAAEKGWDEGQAAVNRDYMAGYDAQIAGEPCPDPTPNPYRAAALASGRGTVCPHGDPTCPCPDGLACHYEDLPGSPAMTPPSGRGTAGEEASDAVL